MKFVDPRNDVAFKKIFGNEHHTEVLIAFLNATLDLHGEHEIVEIELLNPYQAPRIAPLKETILDVRARDRRGITFIVEMQVEPRGAYKKRFLYYVAKAYIDQIERAQDYPRLNQIIFIGIFDFEAFLGANYLTRHLILNTETNAQEISDIEFNFIELPKFTKQEAELETALEKWVYFIKHASSLEMVPPNADTAPLQTAYEIAKKFSWSKAEMELYDYWDMRNQDERGSHEQGRQEGLEQGRQEGLEQGIEQGKRLQTVALAQSLLDVLDDNTISQKTGLSVEEIQAMRSSM